MVVTAIGEIKASLSYGFYCCDKDYERQIAFYILGHSSLREANAGAEAETMEGCCLLACSPWLAQSTVLCTAASPWLAGPFCTNHKSGKCPTSLPTGQSDEDIFSSEDPSLTQMSLACFKLTKRKM